MFAGPDGGQRGLKVRTAGRGDAHDLDVRPGQQFRDLGGGERHAVLGREGPDVVCRAAGDAGELRPRGVGDGLGVIAGDHTGADEAKA